MNAYWQALGSLLGALGVSWNLLDCLSGLLAQLRPPLFVRAVGGDRVHAPLQSSEWSELGRVVNSTSSSSARWGAKTSTSFANQLEISVFCLLGLSWRAFWGPLGGLLGPLGGLLGPLGPSEEVLGPSGAFGGRLGGLSGPSWCPLGALWGRLGALLGASWAILGSSWADFGPF